MIRFDPPWAEIAVVAGLVFLTTPLQLYSRRQQRNLKHLALEGKADKWLKKHWRCLLRRELLSGLVLAPLWEELAFRGPAVMLLQLGHWPAAIIVGLVLNIVFAMLHARGREGIHAHPIQAGLDGLWSLASALISGLLFTSVLMHFLDNRKARRTKELREYLSDPDFDPATLKVIYLTKDGWKD